MDETRPDSLAKGPASAVSRWLVALLVLLVAAPLGAGAHAAASPDVTGGLDLAAMALAPGDVPAGFFDNYDEWWVPATAFADAVGAPPPAGLERLYQSFYVRPADETTLHVFVLEFASPDAATAGAGVVDPLLRPPLLMEAPIAPTHGSGPAIGGEPSALARVTFDTWAAGGPRADIVAVSFRHDRLVAGVSVERYTDPPGDGTAVAARATHDASDPAQEPEQLAADLATTLDGRITAVLASTAPAGVDFALGGTLLPVEQLADGASPVLGGYKSGSDLLRCGMCGEQNSLLPFVSAAVGGIARGVVLGPLVDGEPQPPFVSVALTAYASPSDALAVLAAIRQAPNDRPTAIPVPRGVKTLVSDPAIPGASAALAFHGVLDAEHPDAAPDSAGVDFVVGDRLVTVDVQGGLAGDVALAVAIDLATQQAACVAAGKCATVRTPPALAGIGTPATPAT